MASIGTIDEAATLMASHAVQHGCRLASTRRASTPAGRIAERIAHRLVAACLDTVLVQFELEIGDEAIQDASSSLSLKTLHRIRAAPKLNRLGHAHTLPAFMTGNEVIPEEDESESLSRASLGDVSQNLIVEEEFVTSESSYLIPGQARPSLPQAWQERSQLLGKPAPMIKAHSTGISAFVRRAPLLRDLSKQSSIESSQSSIVIPARTRTFDVTLPYDPNCKSAISLKVKSPSDKIMVTDVDRTSKANGLLVPFDVIEQVNGQHVRDTRTVLAALSSGSDVILTVSRNYEYVVDEEAESAPVSVQTSRKASQEEAVISKFLRPTNPFQRRVCTLGAGFESDNDSVCSSGSEPDDSDDDQTGSSAVV
jgi:hypothetical protein